MSAFFLAVVNMSISASWIVLAVLLLRLLLKKAPKWITVLLWGIVAVRLICPLSIESVLSLIPSAQTINPDILVEQAPVIDPDFPVIDGVENPVINGTENPVINGTDSPVIGEPVTPVPDTTPANPAQIVIPVLSAVWLVGIAGMLAYTIISYFRVKGKVGTAVRLRDNIFQSESVVSPFVLGMIKPKIYLPFCVDGQDMEYVIAHENAHLRRKDHWWKPIGFLILTLHWFNPLLWLGYVLLCRDIELACDEKVIKELDFQQKADYSQALLNCSVNRRILAACPLAFGEVGVKDRVKSVLSYKKPAFWIIVVAIVASIVTAVCFLTDPVDKNPDDPTQQTDPIQQTDPSDATDETSDEKDQAYRDHQNLLAFQVPFDSFQESLDKDNLPRISIPEVGLKNVFTREASGSELLDDGMYGQVYLLADDRYGGGRGVSDHYLAIVMNDVLFVEDISKQTPGYTGDIELCDFDGDGDKEILLQECISMTGGAGGYLSRVFAFDNGKLVEMFSSDIGGNKRFDTGFSITILEDRKFKIENKFTQYSDVFSLNNRKDDYYLYWYDKDGKPIQNEILVDSFYDFLPTDVEGDGVWEIACRQYVSLIGHSDGIGAAKTILKYNPVSSAFEVFQTDFEVYGDVNISSLPLKEAYDYAVKMYVAGPSSKYRDVGELQLETSQIIEIDGKYYQSYVAANVDIRYIWISRSEFPDNNTALWDWYPVGSSQVYSLDLLGKVDEGRKEDETDKIDVSDAFIASCNLNSGGYINFQNGKYYYVDTTSKESLYMCDADGKNAVAIDNCPGATLSGITASETAVYYLKKTKLDTPLENHHFAVSYSIPFEGQLRRYCDGKVTVLSEENVVDYALSKDYIFYTTADMKVYRMKHDGTEKTAIIESTYPNICVSENKLYTHMGEGVSSTDFDGKNGQVVRAYHLALAASESAVYFISADDCSLNKMSLNGETIQKVISDPIRSFTVYHGRLVYERMHTNDIVIADIDGSNPKVVCPGASPIALNGHLFYLDNGVIKVADI